MWTVDPGVYARYPTVCFGVLEVAGFRAQNTAAFAALRDADLAALRAAHPQYERAAFAQTEPIRSYVAYYKQFRKTYHVLQQIESVVLRDKSIPDTPPLVQALLLVEVTTGLLIACHDVDRVTGPLVIRLARGGESMVSAGGEVLDLKADDICMSDDGGFILSIIYGQDSRTRVRPDTHHALYLIDGVEGVSAAQMQSGLAELLRLLHAFHPGLEPVSMQVIEPTSPS